MKVSKLIKESYVEEFFGFGKQEVEYNKPIPKNIPAVEKYYNIKFPVSYLDIEKEKYRTSKRAVLFYNPSELKSGYWNKNFKHGEQIGGSKIKGYLIVVGYENAILTMSGQFYFCFDSEDIKTRVDDAPIIIFDSNFGDAVKTKLNFTEFYKTFKEMPWKYESKKYINEILKLAPQHKYNIPEED